MGDDGWVSKDGQSCLCFGDIQVDDQERVSIDSILLSSVLGVCARERSGGESDVLLRVITEFQARATSSLFYG